MKKRLSLYAGAFIITLIGAAATMLIVNVAYSVEDTISYENLY